MRLIEKVVSFFVKDAAERRKFVNEFNSYAKTAFLSLSVDTLLESEVCQGNPDPSYRHTLSAPRIVSGIAIQARAGVEIPVDDIIAIGKIILSDQRIVRKMYVLHWDTLIVRDTRTGKFVDWRISDFFNYGGLLSGRW